MPKHKKQESESESDSDTSDSGPEEIPAKKSKGDSGSGSSKVRKNEDGESYFDLEKTRRVTVREFKGRIYVDIREYYEKDGKMLPGKKGISLSPSEWSKIKSLMGDIDDVLKKMR